jgi:two-component system, NarL family, invasion response regulator UvrY
MENIKVAVVDDHKLFRDGIVELIKGFSGYEVVIEADNGEDFVRQVGAMGAPDLVLLDINMKFMDGFETAQWLRAQHPSVKILVLSMYDNENAVISMLRHGARGYVLKDIRKQELEHALSSLVTKGYYYTEMITGKLIHALNSGDDARAGTSVDLSALSQREIDFLKLVCTELTYKDIADKMCLSVHTIDGYRDALFEKLKVRSRVGLVLFAIKNKIVFID